MHICNGLQVSSTYKYVVRIINPERKSEHVTKIWHNVDKKFATCKELKLKLIETFEEKLPNFSELKYGYLEKGSKRWVEDDDDLEAMYEIFDSTDEITIWCEGRLSEEQQRKKDAGKKRKLEDADSNDTTSKRAAREKKLEEIVQTLRDKHGEKFCSGPHFRIWARMYLNGQHSSLDLPPNNPLFSNYGPKAPKKESLADALTSAATAVVGLIRGDTPTGAAAMSPGKRARVSGQYLDQLEKLKTLHSSGVLTNEEFEEQKEYALKNIRQLNK